ncbi:hypothetical protein [Halobellus sp. EA9]|uniref:hypothetical protein n=1 Tax=Halobellus sp. EA9 TaxID=3421647 RepID=UPI003EBD3911
MADGDLTFPECCSVCPYRSAFTASCTHDLRQAVVAEIDESRPCPIYAEEKTEAMRQLAESL